MESTEIINRLIEKGHYCYKRNFRKFCPQISRMLDRKQPVTLNETEYRCWRELVVHCMGNMIQEYLPNAQCEVILDMNESMLVIDHVTEKDEQIIMTQLQKMLQQEVKMEVLIELVAILLIIFAMIIIYLKSGGEK